MQSATSIPISIGDTPESSGSSPAKLPTVTLTPSATIRNRYYQRYRKGPSAATAAPAAAANEQQHQHQSKEPLTHEDDSDNNDILTEAAVGWPMTSYYAPLKSPIDSPKSIRSFMSSEEAGSVMSLRTEIFGTDDTYSLSSQKTTDSSHIFHYKTGPTKKSRSNTLFRSKTGAEPKIELDQQDQQFHHHDLRRSKSRGPSSLLSRLSKTTAPMRAKLSAMSRSGSSNNLRSNNFHTPTPLRRSAESMLNMPVTPRKTVMRHKGERSQSFSHGLNEQEPEMKVLKVHESFQQNKYPALLSQVAQMLQERVTIQTKTKDSIEYKDAFDGKHAVDKLCLFIGTKDRNLALLLGRALDAQKVFHDVNYEHRLRDSSHELYQFKQHINYGQKHRFASAGEQEEDDEEDEKSEFNFMDHHVGHTEKDDERLPNGVFTLVTACYSPTCTRNSLCYSIFCPRRIEQQQAKEKTLHRSSSKSSLIDKKDDDRLWINTVPKQVVSKLSSAEKKRQENIFELIYTERDFVNDITYVINYWIEPLLETDVVPEEFRAALVQDLFWNIKEVHAVNSVFADALEERQKVSPVVEQIGDIMLQHVAFFGPFVQYGAHQMVARYVLETEKSGNPAFAAFVEATERLPQSRKLELNGYLTKPTTRLGRYNLLLREILKHTPEDHPDQEMIPKAMKVISEFLSDVNHETGKMESKFSLQLLREKLSYKAPVSVDEHLSTLNLDAEARKVIMKGPLKRKGSGPAESTDLQVYLLDHCLLIAKPKFVNNVERYKIYKKPIPLALLSITLPDHQSRRASSILPYGRPSLSNSISSLNNIDAIAVAAAATSTGTNKGYPITFNYLGRSGLSPITLYAPTLPSRRQWLDMIQSQRQALTEKQKVFDIKSIDARFFNAFNRVTCAASYGKSVVLGSDQGVYLKHERSKTENILRLLQMEKVSQIDVLEQAGLILVLAEKGLYTYSLESLLAEDSAKRGRKLSSHVSFFKVGTVFQDTPAEKTLVCYVRINTMQSTIRALEPHVSAEKKTRSKLSKLMRGNGTGGGGEGLKVYKDLYIPGEASSLQYFKNILCVGSPKGFQMVDLVSAEVQSVLDPNDQSHQPLLHKENIKPISMFRHENSSILLCYNELAFYIDKKGRRLRPEWTIRWEGQPMAFAVSYPYIVAFDTTFIEVRHMDTGDLVQIIPGKNVRCLNPDSQNTIYCAMDDPVLGSELVFELIRV